ncbi:hypothetical protein ACN47E_009296 [Coniothyrium glycines]
MAALPSASALSSLREFFSREDKERLPADLKHAMNLLQLSDFAALEERFLATEAFLRPWAMFRDSILLARPDVIQRATALDKTGADGLSRLDLLWFYTQFDEDARRYDPRADGCAHSYTPDSSTHGVIDKSAWSVMDFEKHLYAWLLQSFQVGKAHNVLGFDYLELRNICTAWEKVFVPIVDVVRASYSVKGRQHYGRLALFIESKWPSRLAFPEDNVGQAPGSAMTSSPFRIVSMPKKSRESDGSTSHKHTPSVKMLTKKQYDETEKELRDVYPQYGGLVERPKFKHKMEEWLIEQRARADLRKAEERHGEVRTRQPQLVQRTGNHSPEKKESSSRGFLQHKSKDVSQNPMKRCSDGIRRSLSTRSPKKAVKEEPKSPLHGVTRQLIFPDADECAPNSARDRDESLSSSKSLVDQFGLGSKPAKQHMQFEQRYSDHASSGQSISSSEKPQDHDVKVNPRPPPKDISPETPFKSLRDEVLAIRAKRSLNEIRVPSYEGTGYRDEISATDLHIIRKDAAKQSGMNRPKTPKTRVPEPIQPVAYRGHLRIAYGDRERTMHPKAEEAHPTQLPWPGSSPPKPLAWPGSELDEQPKPLLPSKSPERRLGARGHNATIRAKQLACDEHHEISRIVSKDNIRAALGGVSCDSSVEDLMPPMPPTCHTDSPARSMSPGGSKLSTFNTHLFPRKLDGKGTPVGARLGDTVTEHATGGS